MESKSYWDFVEYFKHLGTRILEFSDGVGLNLRKNWVFNSFSGLVMMGITIILVLVMTYAYSYLFPISHPMISSYATIPIINNSSNTQSQCNVFEGSWVKDETYPLYHASQCPFVEQGFNCLANGRKDGDYRKWRWKPRNCDIPKFNAKAMLEKFRGKRIVFVGDSMSRTQWESLICLLMTGVEDKSSVYEINGNKITKKIRFLGIRFDSYNLRIDFYRSVFLVLPSGVPKRSPRRVKWTLGLDRLDNVAKEWIDSDVLIFNTGQWWTPGKLHATGGYFQVRGQLKLGMSISSAFRTAVATWASWVENSVNTNRTHVFFRTFEATSWSGRKRRVCKVTRFPLTNPQGRDRYHLSDIVLKTVKNMKVPVSVLHITPMTAFRSDAHVGIWRGNPSVPDCSHWCLPGVPDMWNEILFYHMLSGFEDLHE
ncbi:PC-Esterase [Dillenia turbinata]|uniref:PC-Esterase n=1 Tax=Dillenia turbinata TaxID=194707 RepID=A0AAN8ZHM3_9MAGN